MIRYINENIHKIDKDVDLILNHFKQYFDNLKEGVITSVNSDVLISDESIKANSKSNIDIILIVSEDTSYYDIFYDKIFINIPTEYLDNKSKLNEYLDRIDLIIYHELNYWIDNVFFRYDTANKWYYKINPIMVTIKKFKEKTKNYDELTLIELIDSLFYDTVKSVYDIGGEIEFKKWLLTVFYEMNRRHILQKNMRYLFTFEELNEFHRT